ncbi:MAG TPA: hypothetical protein VFD97_06610 [Acidimicrobiia bacterium]|nr:hypothetical protein [Acidimicrobiia bacterium]
MTQDPRQPAIEADDALDAFETKLDEVDAAEAPETAEEIARRLGDALDHIDGGSRSVTP